MTWETLARDVMTDGFILGLVIPALLGWVIALVNEKIKTRRTR